MRATFPVVALSLMLLLPAWAQAGPVFFDKGLTSAQQSATTTAGTTGAITNFTQADQFTATAGVAWTDVHFWTLEGSTAVAPTVIQYYLWNAAANGDNADTGLLASGSVASGNYSRTQIQTGVSGTNTRWFYEFDLLAPYTFGAPGTYWLGLHFGSTNSVPTDPNALQAWEYSDSSLGSDVYFRVLCSTYTANVCSDFGNWSVQGAPSKNDELAFQLTTRVPEPASLLLLGAGLVTAGVLRRLKKDA